MTTDDARSALNRSGIYAIICNANQKRYVGQAANLWKRRRQHFYELRTGRHPNIHLRRAYEKHGQPLFSFEVLEFCSLELLTQREQFWFDAFPQRERFNLLPVAGTPLGFKHSDETKRKLSAAHKGMKRSPETCRRISEAQKGKKISPEAIEKTRRALTGRKTKPMPERTRTAILRANLGKACSPEKRAAISAANKGRKRSAEAVAKSVLGHVGFKHSDETKKKLSTLKTGLRHSEEAKRKMSTTKRALRLKGQLCLQI